MTIFKGLQQVLHPQKFRHFRSQVIPLINKLCFILKVLLYFEICAVQKETKKTNLKTECVKIMNANLVDWNLFNVITEQCNLFFLPHLGMQKPINIKVNIFYSFPTICTTYVSSSRHPAETAVSNISSGVFSRASPGLYLC